MRSILNQIRWSYKPIRINRYFSNSRPSLSIIGKLTQQSETQENDLTLIEKQKQMSKETDSQQDEDPKLSVTPENDEQLIQFHKENSAKKQIKKQDFIHPLKYQLFNQVVSKHGFFKNDQIVSHNNSHFKFHLKPQEIEILEPSIYLESYRIKSSMKKATVVNRFVRGFNLKTAINQLHFNPKKMSTELEKLLKRGLEQGEKLGLNCDELYISSLWTGSDGNTRKRLQAKGRGRAGLVQHKYIHVKCVIKTHQTKLREKYERELKLINAKPVMKLNDEPLNFKVRPWYKW